MGIDFIQKSAPSFKRAWRAGKEALDQSDFFNQCSKEERTVLADTASGGFVPGQELIIRVANEAITLHRGDTPVGKAVCSPDIRKAIQDRGGFATGVVVKIHPLSGTADLELK